MSARDTMLEAIRAGLRENRAALAAIAAEAPHQPPAHVLAPSADLVDQLVGELTKLEATPHCCDSDTAALERIRQVLTAEPAAPVLAWPEAEIGLPGIDGLLASLGLMRLDGPRGGVPLSRMADARVGITGVDAAIAESGTVIVGGGPGRGRLPSLLAPVHVAVVRRSQIVRGLGEALARLRQRDGTSLLERRSSLTCITGPSRTADIELTLTLGVHGPGRVHVIVRTDG